MADCTYTNPCRASGVGPTCSPAGDLISDPNMPDGVTGHTVNSVNRGEAAKKKCLKDLEDGFKKFIDTCVCDCLRREKHEDVVPFEYQGLDVWCLGQCNIEAVELFDYKDCYCREITCTFSSGGGGGGGTGFGNNGSGTGSGGDGSGSGGGTGSGSDPTTETKYTQAKLGPAITSVRTRSSYDVAIPKVYNRYAVGGNVFWIGNERQLTRDVIDTAQDGNTITVTTTTVTQTYVDFAIALCAGPIDAIARVWVNNELVYNNLLDTDADGDVVVNPATGDFVLNLENFAFFKKVENADKYAKSITKFTFFLGSEDQVAPGVMALESDVGYRGLAYIYVENFEITLTQSVPEIRVDVIQHAATTRPKQVADLDDSPVLTEIKPDVMTVDIVNRNIFLGAEGATIGLRVFNYDGLVEGTPYVAGTTTGIDTSLIYQTAAVSDEGYLFVQDTDLTVHLLNTTGSVSETTYDGLPLLSVAKIGNASTTMHPRLSDSTNPLVFVAAAQRDLFFLRVDPLGNVITELGSSTDFSSLDILKTFVFTADGQDNDTDVKRTFLAVVAAPSVALNTIELTLILVNDTNLNPSFDATDLREYLRVNIPVSAWGGDTSTQLLDILYDPQDQNLVFILQRPDGSGYAFKWNYESATVPWETHLASTPPTGSPGSRAVEISYDNYLYVGRDSAVYSLSFETGAVGQVGTTGDLAPIHANGAQFFDPGSASIVYVDDNLSLARVFVGRASASIGTVKDVVDDLLVTTGLDLLDFDTTQLAAITGWGYGATTQTTVRGMLSQLMTAYGFVAIEEDFVLRFKTATGADEETVEYSDFDISTSAFERTRKTLDSETDAVTLTYLDVNKGMAITSQTVRSPTNGVGGSGTQGISFGFPIVADADQAILMAERLYARSTFDNEVATVRLGPKYLYLQPGDYLRAFVADGSFYAYLISSASLGHDYVTELTLQRDSRSVYTETPNLVSVSGLDNYTGSFVAFQQSATYRPLIIMTNALANSQIELPSRSGFFVGVDYRGPLPMPATPVYVSRAGTYVSAGTATAPVMWGRVTSPPGINDSSNYTVDENETMTIKFVRDDAATIFVQDASLADLLADLRLNLLLVNDELIQFRHYEVLGDGFSIRFSRLLRGLRGTEWGRHTHQVDTPAYAYSEGSWQATYIDSDQVYSVVLAAATKTISGRFTTVNATLTHPMLRYFGPSNIMRTRLINNDILIQFERRSRIIPDPTTELDAAPPDDTFIATDRSFVERFYEYAILSGPLDRDRLLAANEVLDGGGVSDYIVRRTKFIAEDYVNGPSTPRIPLSARYSLSQQVEDGFDVATDTMYLVVYEVDPAAGVGVLPKRGHPGYRVIEPHYAN